MSPKTAKSRQQAAIPARYQFPRMVEQTHGPWLGVRDGPAMTEGDAQHAQAFKNCYIEDPGNGGAVLCRPGWQVMTTAGQLLGTPANRYPQGIACYDPPGGISSATASASLAVAGFPVVYAFVGGRMFTIANGVAIGLWGDVTPSNVTISPNAPFVWTVNFAGKLIVSDGVNPPWTWDGQTATYIDWDLSGITSHTCAYGPPAVYYDQLFFVMNTGTVGGAGNRTTLIWSEPNNPTLGYIQTVAGFTYADTWTLSQTGSDDIQAICGTNTALFYWRKGSTGALYGSPALNFATTATHDAISQTTGTLMAKSVIQTDREIYFLDQTGRPHVILYGGYVTPIWQDCYATLVVAASAMFPPNVTQQLSVNAPTDNGSGCYDPNTKCVYWSVASLGNPATSPPTIYAMDTRTKKYYGQWTHSSKISPTIGVFQLATVTNPAGGLGAYPAQLVMHLDLTGNFYLLQGQGNTLPAGQGIDKTLGNNVYTIENSVQASQMLADPSVETTTDRAEWSTLPFLFCQVNLDYQNTRSLTFSLAQNVTQPLTATNLRAEITCGINATGRSILPRISNAAQVSLPGQTLNLNAVNPVQVKLRGYQVDMNPSSP